MTRRTIIILLAMGLFTAASFALLLQSLHRAAPPAFLPAATLPPAAPPTPSQAKIVAGARAQIGDAYDASYCVLSYPNGDPPAGRGACTDVVVRGLRADGLDLQTLVHADMTRHWDTLPNMVTPKTLSTWEPGDIVCWKMPGGGDHTGLVSDRRDLRGIPLVIHNLGGCQEQDVLTNWTIAGHYRYPK